MTGPGGRAPPRVSVPDSVLSWWDEDQEADFIAGDEEYEAYPLGDLREREGDGEEFEEEGEEGEDAPSVYSQDELSEAFSALEEACGSASLEEAWESWDHDRRTTFLARVRSSVSLKTIKTVKSINAINAINAIGNTTKKLNTYRSLPALPALTDFASDSEPTPALDSAFTFASTPALDSASTSTASMSTTSTTSTTSTSETLTGDWETDIISLSDSETNNSLSYTPSNSNSNDAKQTLTRLAHPLALLKSKLPRHHKPTPTTTPTPTPTTAPTKVNRLRLYFLTHTLSHTLAHTHTRARSHINKLTITHPLPLADDSASFWADEPRKKTSIDSFPIRIHVERSMQKV
jgi:hypothetical protein